MNRALCELNFAPDVPMYVMRRIGNLYMTVEKHVDTLHMYDGLDERKLVHDAIVRGFSAEYIHFKTHIPYDKIQYIADKTITYEYAKSELDRKPYAANASIYRKLIEHKEHAAEKQLLAIIGY